MVLEQLYIHMQKKKKKKKNFNPYLPPYIVSNQMDHRPKYKT